MQDNELIEILKEFDEKRVGQLNDNARNLFYAIMELADYRDRLLEEKQEIIDYLKNYKLNQEIKEQQKEFICGYECAIKEILSKIEKE